MSSQRPGLLHHGTGRLPPIAPRDEQQSQASNASGSQSSVADLPKHKLPPRSRSGCWTCRTRKVKCDEARPSCNQCTRLGHSCDYSPKLSFKDETPKIVHKYLGPSPSIEQWDPTAELSTLRTSRPANKVDDLPPFTSLSTEEDWQRKAEHQRPGTFFVVANSSSFVGAEEYRQSPDIDADQAERSKTHIERNIPNATIDPGTLILGRIEDTSQRIAFDYTSSLGAGKSAASNSPATSPIAVTHGLHLLSVSSTDRIYQQLQDFNSVSGRRLVLHYRLLVRSHILQACGPLGINVDNNKEDAFEMEAERFLPLRHAILALSALSLFSRGEMQKVDALQHYQQALGPLQSLRREEDLASDGAFLTHFLLLLYEIAGSETERFWSSHMSSLTRIVQIRHRVLDTEPFPYVVWWVCIIDVIALLGGSGNGEFIGTLMEQDLIPTALNMRESRPFCGSGTFLDEDELENVLDLWRFQRQIVLVAARVGKLGRQIRGVLSRRQEAPNLEQARQWQEQSLQYCDMLKQTWETEIGLIMVGRLEDTTWSERSRPIFDFAQLIFHTCTIYAHGMMWPSQRLDAGVGHSMDCSHAAMAILNVAYARVEREQLEYRSLVFPLLLAGAFVESASEKMKAQDLMQALEADSIGYNTGATRRLLETICERQNNNFMAHGHSLDVDCIEVMNDMGQQTVHCGL